MSKIVDFIKKLFVDELGEFMKNASDEELSAKREEYRQIWMKNGFGGNGEHSVEMKRLGAEIIRRANEKWLNNPNRNTDPIFRWTDSNRWDKD